MFHIRQAVTELTEQVKVAGDSDVRVTQPVSAGSIALIDWLNTQPLFPKFYWYSRNGEEEVAALGQICTFSEPEPAYALISDEQRIWGGRAFDGHTGKNPDFPSAFFFLPQIELFRQGEQWMLAVNLGEKREDALQALASLLPAEPLPVPIEACIHSVSHTPDFSGWQSLLEDALQRIENNAFKKVVLARQSTVVPDRPVSAAQLLKTSMISNRDSFHFMLAIKPGSSFIGSTPERLYLRDGLSLETEALAGTIGRGSDARQDQELADWLVHDEKNLTENQFVVDDIIDCLNPYADVIDVEAEAHLVCLRKVQHLKRKIHACLKPGINGVHLLAALQPTAAVAGLPRAAALAYILDKEPFPRGWYAGSMGYISHQKAQICVAIRSAEVSDGLIRLYAGAGILPGSDAEFEWQELDRKMSTLLSLLKETADKERVSVEGNTVMQENKQP
ncbi:isochorismate synthase [Vibrio sp. HA2012]|uniref:isochorismate synthase n=1 Tax=Vibrio sp. HA2012 TaxID=1971595 RepID=UPI000C2BE359|nr:isochorismate synthase [Vibrio sp. HA2012]PJC85520.1 isochorismate synthase [Vibrio sp. HA2012]